MPLVEMLETIRRQAMIRIDKRRKTSRQCVTRFTPRVDRVLLAEEEERKHCTAYPGPSGTYEVRERDSYYTVNMKFRTCICRRWDLSGIPCRHALRVLADYSDQYDVNDMIISWYRTYWWQKTYTDSIIPLNGRKFWKESGETPLEAPPIQLPKGRRKGPEKRKPGINESPTKGKTVTRHGNEMHCSICKGAGHNRSTCALNPNPKPKKNMKPKKSAVEGEGPSHRNPGPKKNPKPRKKARTTKEAVEAYALDDGEGPSQPTQPTQ